MKPEKACATRYENSHSKHLQRAEATNLCDQRNFAASKTECA